MMLKCFFYISTGFRFQRSVLECSVHICSCPWIIIHILQSPAVWTLRQFLEILKKTLSWLSFIHLQVSNIPDSGFTDQITKGNWQNTPLGTGWMGEWVEKMATFAYYQYIRGGWVRKRPAHVIFEWSPKLFVSEETTDVSYQRDALVRQSVIMLELLKEFVEYRGNNTYLIQEKTALMVPSWEISHTLKSWALACFS